MSSDENTSTVKVKMRPMLSDMPPNIKQMIAERTDVKSRYSLRKVNTHFRDAVDKSPYNFCMLWMRRYSNCVKLMLKLGEYIEIKYKKHGENGCVIKRSDTTDKIIEGEDFEQRAFDDLGIILKSPQVLVERFGLTDFGPGTKSVEKLLAKLGTFRHQLNIRVLEANGKSGQDDVVQLLNHVTPRTLETLDIFNLMSPDISVDRIADTEQWRHLKEVTGGKADKVPIDKILHLEYFYPIKFKLTEQSVEEIVQWVRQHRDISMKYRFFGRRNRDIVKNWQNAVSEHQPSRERIRIPGTERYLEINLERQGVTFKTIGGSRDQEESDGTDEDDDEDDETDSDTTDSDEPDEYDASEESIPSDNEDSINSQDSKKNFFVVKFN